MNAISSRIRPPTPDAISGEIEHARMARNRQGRPPTVALRPLSESDAFRVPRLHQAVRDAQARLDAAKAVPHRGTKAEKRAAARTVSQASAALIRAQTALSDEIEGERAAPAAQRLAVEAGGVVLREARAVTQGGRASVVMPIDRMLARKQITRAQHAAGRRYRSAWEAANADAMPAGFGGEFGGGVPSSGNRRIEDAVGMHAELTRMQRVLGVIGCNLVEWVVVQEMTVDSWAARQPSARGEPMSSAHAMGVLVFLLGRLGEDE